jgi:hypothetical protein
MLPGCEVIKLDPRRKQGMLDLLILHGRKWGMLEVKRDKSAPFRPNQEHYVERYGRMSFAAVIYPENEKEVLAQVLAALGAEG